MLIVLLHFHTFGVVVEWRTDLVDGGQLLVFGCVDNEALNEWVFIELLTLLFFIYDEVDVWFHFPDCIDLIVDCVYLFVGPYFSELSFGVVPEVEVLKLQSLLCAIWIKPKFTVVVADLWSLIVSKLMLPFSNRFGIAYPQIPYVIVKQMVITSFVPLPADQFALFEVPYVCFIYFGIHWGAPFLVGLQVNQPYFSISTLPYHNLLRTDHLNWNLIQIFNFHFLPEQNLSFGVSVKKNNASFAFSTLEIALLRMLH